MGILTLYTLVPGRMSADGRDSRLARLAGFALLLLAFIFFSRDGLAQAPVQLSAGHVIGTKPTAMASQLLKSISDQLPGIDVYYDATSTDEGLATGRFQQRDDLADIVFVYVGSTDALDEVSGLMRDGKIQPIDCLPGYSELIKPDDIYPNLLTPVTMSGHVWAVPVRVCLPLFVVKEDLGPEPRTWTDIERFSANYSFTPSLDEDWYCLWISLLAQRGASRFTEGRYDLTKPQCRRCFDLVANFYAYRRLRAWKTADLCLANSDSVTDYSTLVTDMRPFPLPAERGDAVYCAAWSWYVAVSSRVAGPSREAATTVLATMLSPEVQLEVGRATNGSPVRPSLASSGQFAAVVPAGSPLAVIKNTTPRLAFRDTGALSARTEPLVEAAFRRALEQPDNFGTIMAEVEARANAVILEASWQEQAP